MSSRPSSTADLVRSALVYASVLPCLAASLPIWLATGDRRRAGQFAITTWSEFALAASGVDLRVEGEEHLWSQRPAVFIFNHQSGFDVPLMCKLLQRDFTGAAKAEVQSNPLFGPLFAFAGGVFLDRADRAKAIEALGPAVEALRHGTSLAISPEGTRSETARIGPFKKGAFHVAMQAGVPIVPIVFHNALDALPRHALVVRPATVRAVVLPPVPTEGWTREGLDQRIGEIRGRFLEILEPQQ